MSEDDDVTLNVAAQRKRAEELSRHLDDADARAAALEASSADAERFLSDRGITTPEATQTASQRPPDGYADVDSWEALTAANESWLIDRDWDGLSLDDVLTTSELDLLESFDALGRERWTADDFATVGACGALGLLATLFDDQVDAAVKYGLAGIGKTSPLRGFEAAGKRLPIDYTGPGFGGPGHRVRSAGHDVGRPWQALSQIRSGQFQGWEWDQGMRFAKTALSPTPGGVPYAQHSLAEALVLWLMHLSADYVTTLSLPLPWWSNLYECDNRELRKLAHDLYNPGASQVGLNQRSMLLSKTLPVISTEVIVRVKVALDARTSTGRFGALTANQKLRRNEMLFCGHAATGVASIVKTVAVAPAEHALTLRHLNPPALIRLGFLSVKVLREYQRRRDERAVPSWDDLLLAEPFPWELDELSILGAHSPAS